ncbi:Rrf2 family transcriptional regulator [Christensenellaceae bacterium OttesenSCG-928-K19]|nr:Rrf2 family transcriptional regulator [Christensenellaceae bacterium OttesenSCG-928-K19]
MKLSTKGKYGLRALVDLAVNSGEEAVSINSIAQRQDISEGYLEQLMAKLKKAGIVVSTRGARGGYTLAKPADEIWVGDVLRALEGSIEPVDCPGIEGACTDADSCVTKTLWKRINDGVNMIVDQMSLQSLIEEGMHERKVQHG